MNHLSLRNNRLMFIETSWESPVILDESMGIYLDLIKESQKKITTCDRLDLETLGFRPIMLTKSPRTLLNSVSNESWRREGIIVYECTSHPFNMKTWPPYLFVVSSSQMTLSRVSQELLELILVSNELRKLISRLHTISRLLCWMNNCTLVFRENTLSLVWNGYSHLIKIMFCVMYALTP